MPPTVGPGEHITNMATRLPPIVGPGEHTSNMATGMPPTFGPGNQTINMATRLPPIVGPGERTSNMATRLPPAVVPGENTSNNIATEIPPRVGPGNQTIHMATGIPPNFGPGHQATHMATGIPPILGPGEHISPVRNILQERDPNINTSPPSRPPAKGNASRSKNSPNSTKSNSRKKQPSDLKASDLSSIHLAGEEDETVPIYATASDIRRQIQGHLNRSKTTKAAFARELNELVPHSSVSSQSLARFLKANGPKGGAHSPVFYAAYVLFEKKRIKDGKKPTLKRQEMEKIWEKEGGFPRDSNNWITCLQGERPSMDQYGQWHIFDPVTGRDILED